MMNNKVPLIRTCCFYLFIAALISACSIGSNQVVYDAAEKSPSTGDEVKLWVDPEFWPEELVKSLNLPPGIAPAKTGERADFWLQVSEQRLLSEWIFALVVPFGTTQDEISFDELEQVWTDGLNGMPVLLDKSTKLIFSQRWGEPAPGAVKILAEAELLDYAWYNQPSWALVPFEKLEPRWKVLSVGGQNPIEVNFDSSLYPLTIPIALTGEETAAQAISSVYGESLLPKSNRSDHKITALVMTGVTAMVRATAFTMEQEGILYPAQDVGDWLREAHITHISNEVSFAEDCPYPNPVQQSTRFCSRPAYIQLLEHIGTDIVELTGDHFGDWGEAAMLNSLDMYRERAWPYFGGGENIDDSRSVVKIEHNGNKLAFLGCNAKQGAHTAASESGPGAADCKGDWMQEEVRNLKSGGYLPVVTFQHNEYYTYEAQPDQRKDFGEIARAGAVIVSGSQAHQPQGMEFVDNAFVHYGLGNLFFDQYDVSPAARSALIDRHIFYYGRFISTQLLTAIFVDYARPRAMNNAERNELLKAVFSASGW